MKKLLTVVLFLSMLSALGQQKTKTFPVSAINKKHWRLPNDSSATLSTGRYMGADAFIMRRKVPDFKAAGIAYLEHLEFKNGIIEADLAWPGKKGGFVGLAFRIKDIHHYDVIYFRPESSGTANAVQYMPEKKTVFNWWDYESLRYQAKATLPLHDWFHVKISVKGNTLTVFVGQNGKPVMVFNDLDPDLPSGSVGLWFGNSEICAYKNLSVKYD